MDRRVRAFPLKQLFIFKQLQLAVDQVVTRWLPGGHFRARAVGLKVVCAHR